MNDVDGKPLSIGDKVQIAPHEEGGFSITGEVTGRDDTGLGIWVRHPVLLPAETERLFQPDSLILIESAAPSGGDPNP